MNKKLMVLICVALAAMLAVCAVAGCKKKAPEGESTEGKVQVTVAYAAGEGDDYKSKTTTVWVDEDATVYDAMEASGWALDAEDGQWGKFIHSIDGIGDSANTGWVYTEDGNEVMDGADSHKVIEGSTYDWKLISW